MKILQVRDIRIAKCPRQALQQYCTACSPPGLFADIELDQLVELTRQGEYEYQMTTDTETWCKMLTKNSGFDKHLQ